MVPQTAMPVLAEEANAVEEQKADVTPADDADELDESTSGTADVGKTGNPDNLGVSGTTDDGQNNEEGDPADNDTSVINDPADDGQDQSEENPDGSDATNPDETGAGSDEELTEEIKPSEEEELAPIGFSLNSMEEADIKVSVYQVEKKSDGTSEYNTLSDAKISFLDNTVDYDEGQNSGPVNAKEKDILFKVTTNDGYKLEKLEYARAEQAEDLTAKPTLRPISGADASNANKQYQVPINIAQLIKDNQHVAIYVTVTPVEYTVASTNTATNTPAIHTKGVNGYNWNTPSSPNKVAYDGTVTFAVKTSDDLKVTAIKSGDGESSHTVTLTGTKVAAVTEGPAEGQHPAYTEFTLNASDIVGLNPTNTDTIAVTVADPDGAATLTLKAANYVHTNVVVIQNKPSNATGGYLPTGAANNETFTAGAKIYFQAEAADEYKLGEMEAYWTPSAQETPKNSLDITTVTETTNGITDTYYVIDLKGVTGSTADLHVILNAELDDTVAGVKTMSFAASEGNHVKVARVAGDLPNAEKSLLGKTFNANGDSYSYVVKPEEGHEISKVEVEVEKRYTDGTTPAATEKFEIGADGERMEDGESLEPITYQKNMTILFDGQDKTVGGVPGKTWTAKKVNVTITTQLVTSATDKTVRFISWGNYETGTIRPTGAYEISVAEDEAGKVTYNKETKECSIAAGAEYVVFSVKADVTAPVISADGGAVAEQIEGDGFTYRISAAALKDKGNIYVKRQPVNVAVNYKTEDTMSAVVTDMDTVADANVADKVFDLGPANDAALDESVPAEKLAKEAGYTHRLKQAVNADAKIKIEVELADATLKESTAITGITCLVGGAEQKFAYNAATGKYEIEVKATGDITVNVDKSEDRKLVVKSDGTEVSPEDGLYLIDKYNKAIIATVYSGGTAQNIYSTSVKIGGKNAKTKAQIKNNTEAEILVNEEEYNSELEVEIVLADKERSRENFTIKTLAPVTGVTYGPEVVEGAVKLPVDTVVRTSIEAVGAPAENLKAAVVAGKDAKDVGTTPATNNTYVSTEVKNGELIITAKPSAKDGKGRDKAAYIALYNDNDSSAKKAVIEGSIIEVNTENATISGKTPTVTIPSSTSRNLRVHVEPLEGAEYPNVGDLAYKVEIENKTLKGDAKKAFDKALESVQKYYWYWDGSFNEDIRVIWDTIKNSKNEDVFFEGQALDGFQVKVTVLQSTSANAFGSKANTYPIIDGTIEGNCIKSETGTADGSTVAPYYENTGNGKLKLKKLNATVVTGNKDDQAVAEPVFEAGATYKQVQVSMVDMKTGIEAPTWNGLEAWYDALSGKVMVHSTSYGNLYLNNVSGNYKDVGIKVAVINEDDNYGSTGTMKLNVVNGLEVIEVNAQPYVIKQAGKKATFKLEEVLNDSATIKARAPKDKALRYEFVKATTTTTQVENGTYEMAPAEWALQGNNGTITVNKDYAVSKVEENNQFKILVRAKNWQGNDEYDLTEVVTLTETSESVTGRVQIMKAGRNEDGTYNWAKATLVSGETLAVTDKNDAEYRLVVLRKGTPLDRPSYNLNLTLADANCVIEDPNGYTFAPAKGNAAVDTDGYIKVSKLGKVTFTVTDKSDKKNKITIKKELVSGGTAPVLRFWQLDDSTFMEHGKTIGKVHYSESFEFEGNNTTYFALDVIDGKTNEELMLSDAKVGFKKNTKNITPKKAEDWRKYGDQSANQHQYLLAVTGKNAEITFQLKGGKTETYKLTNKNFAELKAPKATLANKGAKITAGRTNPVSVKLTSGKDSFEGKYVMLSLDNTKNSPIDAKNRIYDLDKAIPVGEGSVFDFSINPGYTGTYNMNVAVGTLNEGVFTQQYADAKLAVKVSQKGTAKVKVTGNYKLDPNVASVLKIQYNQKDGDAYFVVDDGDERLDGNGKFDTNRNFALNSVVKGVPNAFTKYFEAKQGADGYISTIGLRSDISAVELAEIMDDSHKDDRVGWIRVSNGDTAQDVKITMSFVTIKNLKAVATPVVEGKNVTTVIKLYSGKDYVAVEDYELTVADGFVYEKKREDRLKVSEDGSESDILLTSGDQMMSKGKKKLELMVVPKNTLDINKKDMSGKFLVKATVDVGDANKGSKVQFAKDATKWEVQHSDFTNADKVNTEGAWKKNIPYSFERNLSVPDGTEIRIAAKDAPWITFTSDAYDVNKANQKLTAVIDKKALSEAMSAERSKIKPGKTVTVKTSFTYVNEKTPVNVKGTDVTFSIKLFSEIGTADDVKAAFTEDVENEIQNLVETQYKYAADRVTDVENAEAKKVAAAQESAALAAKVEARAKNVTAGATVDVTVATNYADGTPTVATSYTVTVMNGTSKAYEKAFKVPGAGIDLDSIMTAIKTWSGFTATDAMVSNYVGTGAWMHSEGIGLNAVSATDYVKLTKDTSETEYANMVRALLTKLDKIDNRFSIRVEKDAAKSVEPTASANGTGKYVATIIMTDRTKTPVKNSVENHKRITITTTLNKLETGTNAATRLAAKLIVTNNADAGKGTLSTLDTIMTEAWKAAVAAGVKEDTDSRYDTEIENQILAMAKSILAEGNSESSEAANEKLTVKEVVAGSLEKTLADNTNYKKVTALSCELVLTDATGAEAKDIPVAVDFTGNCDITGLQTIAGLKAKVNSEASKMTIKAATEEAAYAAVKAEIAKLSTNPAYDTKNTLKVEPTDPKKYVPAGKTNGFVNVKVTFSSVSNDTYTNIVILAGDGLKGGTEDEKKLNKAIDLVKAGVSRTEIEAVLLDMWNTWAAAKLAGDTSSVTTEEPTKANLIAKIEGMVGDNTTGLLKDTGYAILGTGGVTLDPDSLTMPTNAKTGMTLPKVTIKIKATGAADSAVAATIEIAGSTILKNRPEFQSLDEAQNAIKGVIGGDGTTGGSLTVNYLNLITSGSDTSTDLTSGSATGSKEKLTAATETKLKSLVTNPAFAFTTESTAGTDNFVTTNANYHMVVSNWKVKLQDKAAADPSAATAKKEITLTVNEKKQADTVAISSIAIAATKNDAGDGDESGVDATTNAITRTITGEKSSVKIDVTPTFVNNDAANKPEVNYSWKAEVVPGDNSDTQEGITIDPTGATTYLNVSSETTGGADHQVVVKVTATTDQPDENGKAYEKIVYIKLTLKPEVSSFTIDGPSEIELASTGGSADGSVFTAHIEGKYLHEDDVKTYVVWSTTEGLTKTSAPTGVTTVTTSDTSKVTIKFGSTTPADAGLTADHNKITASLDAPLAVTSDNVRTATYNSFTFKRTAAVTESTTIELGSAAGVTPGETEQRDDDQIDKYTITGGEARIPLSINADGDIAGRDWTFTLAASGDTGNEIDAGDYSTSLNYATDDGKIRIKKSGKQSWLVIPAKASAILDERAADAEATPAIAQRQAKTIKITATSAGAGNQASITATAKTIALVINKSVAGVSVNEHANASTETKKDGDDSTKPVEIATPGAGGSHVYLRAAVTGSHLTTDEAAGKANVTYSLRKIGNAALAGATVEKGTADSAITNGSTKITDVTVPEGAEGTLIVKAVYKDADTGLSAQAERVIVVKAEDASIVAKDSGDSDISSSVDINKNTTSYVAKFSIDDASDITWNASATGALNSKITKAVQDDGSYNVTLNTETDGTGVVGGTYVLTVTAQWIDDTTDTLKSAKKTLTFNIDRTVTGFTVTKDSATDDMSTLEVPAATSQKYAFEIANTVTTGSITLKVVHTGSRLTDDDKTDVSITLPTEEAQTAAGLKVTQDGNKITISRGEDESVPANGGGDKKISITLVAPTEGGTLKVDSLTNHTIEFTAKAADS